jgi:hypothetical protein
MHLPPGEYNSVNVFGRRQSHIQLKIPRFKNQQQIGTHTHIYIYIYRQIHAQDADRCTHHMWLFDCQILL